MPLITLPQTEIIIDIPGTMQIGEEVFTRKIKVINLEYSCENKSVITQASINFYDANGEPVTSSLFIHSYGVSMVADNSVYCDMAGMVLCSKAQAEANPTLVESKDYMPQFDWFYNVASSAPIVLNEMIKQFYLRAVAAGRFD